MSSGLTAFCAFETFERRLESTYCGPSRQQPWTPQLGGTRAYKGRLGKDRTLRRSRRSIASANKSHSATTRLPNAHRRAHYRPTPPQALTSLLSKARTAPTWASDQMHSSAEAACSTRARARGRQEKRRLLSLPVRQRNERAPIFNSSRCRMQHLFMLTTH
jgi:hypothetical protein